MNIENIAAILFLVFLTLFLIKERKKLHVQSLIHLKKIPILYFALYKTKVGLKNMEFIAKKHPKTINVISKIGAVFGILGILLISYVLIENLFKLLLVPATVSGVGLVLPFKTKGSFFVPFFYWIISIFFIAGIHEFSHGVAARLHKVPIKSSGFAFLGLVVPIIPAAFVEPNEKVLAKKKRADKLAVYAAGPFSNVLSGALVLALFILLSYPVAANVIEFNGVHIEDYTNASASKLAGVPLDATITGIDKMQVAMMENLSSILQNKSVGETVSLETTNGTYAVKLGTNPDNSSLPYLGLLLSQSQKTKESFNEKYGEITGKTIIWFLGLLYWIYILSIGIGLFNLAPIAPADGGQMLREIYGKFIKNQKTAMKAWHITSTFFVLIIIINVLFGFF